MSDPFYKKKNIEKFTKHQTLRYTLQDSYLFMSQIGQNKTQSTFSHIGYAISHSHAAWGSQLFTLSQPIQFIDDDDDMVRPFEMKKKTIFRSHVMCICVYYIGHTYIIHNNKHVVYTHSILTNIQQYNVVQYVTHKKWSVLLVCARTIGAMCGPHIPIRNPIFFFFLLRMIHSVRIQWTK